MTRSPTPAGPTERRGRSAHSRREGSGPSTISSSWSTSSGVRTSTMTRSAPCSSAPSAPGTSAGVRATVHSTNRRPRAATAFSRGIAGRPPTRSRECPPGRSRSALGRAPARNPPARPGRSPRPRTEAGRPSRRGSDPRSPGPARRSRTGRRCGNRALGPGLARIVARSSVSARGRIATRSRDIVDAPTGFRAGPRRCVGRGGRPVAAGRGFGRCRYPRHRPGHSPRPDGGMRLPVPHGRRPR